MFFDLAFVFSSFRLWICCYQTFCNQFATRWRRCKSAFELITMDWRCCTLMDATSDALCLNDSICSAMCARLQMIMGTEERLPCNGGRWFDSVTPNEFIAAAYLNPRFSAAAHACYGWNERLLSSELERIIEFRFPDDCHNCDTDRNSNNLSNDDITSSKSFCGLTHGLCKY